MNLHQLFLTKNECYIYGKKITPIGIMVHSTAANNPNIARYVGPDDGILGKNKYNNHWNDFRPGCNAYPDGGSRERCNNCPLKAAQMEADIAAGVNPNDMEQDVDVLIAEQEAMFDENGEIIAGASPKCRQVCVHGFIGKVKDGSIATYQTLPFDKIGWHSGSGSKGNANYLGYIGFEICEDDRTGEEYFDAVYKEAAEFCAYICKLYNFDPTTQIIDHKEGNKKGIASNHGDVGHWFPKHGKSMDTFRQYVKELMAGDSEPEVDPEPEPEQVKFEVNDIVKFKDTATVYYPGSSNIPGWVKNCNHLVTQVTVGGKANYKNGAESVLLGNRFNKDELINGIMTWVDISNLEFVGKYVKPEEDKTEPEPTPDPVVPDPVTPEPDPVIPEPEPTPTPDPIEPDTEEKTDPVEPDPIEPTPEPVDPEPEPDVPPTPEPEPDVEPTPDPEPTPDDEDEEDSGYIEYTTEKGDNVFSLAKEYCGSIWMFFVIMILNRSFILSYKEGTVIKLPAKK